MSLDDITSFIKQGGSAAAPLAVASWGMAYLSSAAKFPPPFGSIAPWACLVAIYAGAGAAAFRVLWQSIKSIKTA
jgi:hypothetical protein